jgi:hypothetical protein
MFSSRLTAMEALIRKMAAELSSKGPKTSNLFLIVNYDLVLTLLRVCGRATVVAYSIQEREKGLNDSVVHFKELLNKEFELLIDATLNRHFGYGLTARCV